MDNSMNVAPAPASDAAPNTLGKAEPCSSFGFGVEGQRTALSLPLATPDRTPRSGDAVREAMMLIHGIVHDEPGVFAFTAQGHSMRDALVADGDMVMLQESARPRNGEQAAVRVSSGRVKLRRVYYEGDQVRLQPENRRMPAERVARHELDIVGRVIAIVRQDPRARAAGTPVKDTAALRDGKARLPSRPVDANAA